MIQESEGQEKAGAKCVHGVNEFNNHGQVNLMILTVGDPEQAMRLVREMLDRTEQPAAGPR